ncbi:MAG: hypothetical protein Q4Q06_03470 [Bacteroidota bacterium]|nr:hypothetical protein [Bacteroidota bacterium]
MQGQKLKFFSLCLFLILSFGAKTQNFVEVQTERKGDVEVYHIAKMDLLIENGNLSLQTTDKTPSFLQQINICKEKSTCKLLYNNKLKEGFLFVEPSKEIKEGCNVYHIKNKSIISLGYLSFAAYTSENGERMNYNSILPYISVIRSDKRTLLFFNTPIVVFFPNSTKEQILESKNFYHTLENNTFVLQNYK